MCCVSLDGIFLNFGGVCYDLSFAIGTMVRFGGPVYVFILEDCYLLQPAFVEFLQ